MAGKSGHDMNYSAMGITFGIIAIIVSIIWISMTNVSDDESSGDGVTWVG